MSNLQSEAKFFRAFYITHGNDAMSIVLRGTGTQIEKPTMANLNTQNAAANTRTTDKITVINFFFIKSAPILHNMCHPEFYHN